MIVYNINIDMSSERNIPYEDEVSPGPSRQATINNNNNTKDGGDGSSSGGESGDGKDGGSGSSSRNTPTPEQKQRPSTNDSSSSDTVRKIGRTVRKLKNKLKKMNRKRKRSSPRGPHTEERQEDFAPAQKVAKISTSTPVTAFAPRLRAPQKGVTNQQQHLRSADSAAQHEHLRSAAKTIGEHLRSAKTTTEEHLRSATPLLSTGEESDPPEDDMISLLDDEAWPDGPNGDLATQEHPESEVDQEALFVDPQEADEDKENSFEELIEGLNFVTATEAAGPAINSAWADKLKNVWLEENNLHSMKPIYEKYKIPSNCESVCAPAMNPEMKRLLSTKWDKKTDINYSGMQKTLTKIFAATVQLNDLNMCKTRTQTSTKQGMQITTDIVAMLGQVSSEISNRRKFHLGKVIQPQFRQLCSKESVKPTKLLFGENITQLIKDVQVKNKIGYKDDHNRGTRGRSSGKPFLGYGRGRSYGRAPRGRGYNTNNSNNQKNYQGHYQNTHKKKN